MSLPSRPSHKVTAFASGLFTLAYRSALLFGACYMLYVPIAVERDKTALGGDYEVLQWAEPIPYNLSAFMLFNAKNISRVEDGSTIATHGRYNANVSIRGIDAQYPLYGSLQVLLGKRPYPFFYDHSQNLHGVVVDRRTLKVLRLRLGDKFTIGRGYYEVSGILLGEPDPPIGKMALLPRVIMSNTGFADTHIAEDTPQRTLFRCRALLHEQLLSSVKIRYSYIFHYPTWAWKNWDGSPEPD